MQSKMNLMELAQEIQRQREVRRDFVAPSEKIGVAVDSSNGGELKLRLQDHDLPLTDHAHGQVASRLGIPKIYYDRLRNNHPEILAANVHGLMQREPHKFLVRTMDDRVRAVMSDRYRPLDHDLMLEAALPVLHDRPSLEITSLQMTERRLYLQVVDHKIEGEVKPGEVVRAGFTLSNSEVGAGAVSVEEMIWRLVCANGLITAKALRRHHVGQQLGGGNDEIVADFYQSDTNQATARAFLLKLRDTLQFVLSPQAFNDRVNLLRAAANRPLALSLPEVMEVTAARLSLSKEEGDSVLTHLAKGGDFTQWGLTNAITSTARELEGDRSYELEKAAGNIIEMKPDDWGRVYQKAA